MKDKNFEIIQKNLKEFFGLPPMAAKILYELLKESELDADEIARRIDNSRSKVYQNLKLLEEAGLVISMYKSSRTYYKALNKLAILEVFETKILEWARNRISEIRQALEDIEETHKKVATKIKKVSIDHLKERLKTKKKRSVKIVAKHDIITKFVNELIEDIHKYGLEDIKIYKPYDLHIEIPKHLKEKAMKLGFIVLTQVGNHIEEYNLTDVTTI